MTRILVSLIGRNDQHALRTLDFLCTLLTRDKRYQQMEYIRKSAASDEKCVIVDFDRAKIGIETKAISAHDPNSNETIQLLIANHECDVIICTSNASKQASKSLRNLASKGSPPYQVLEKRLDQHSSSSYMDAQHAQELLDSVNELLLQKTTQFY